MADTQPRERRKTGLVPAVDFVGAPRVATVTFAQAYPDANYSIAITGVDARSWTYQTKTAAGFVINTNANQALTGEVSWQTFYQGETL